MAPASAHVLLPAAAVALMVMALQLSAAAADALLPAPGGQPGCNTICGNVMVPYPFGFGPSRCYWPGLNLICDTSRHPPRLLLGDGTLRVTEISLWRGTVSVMRNGSIINTTGDFNADSWNASLVFGSGFREHSYRLSARNELVVSGCNVMATISADIVGEQTSRIVSGCASFCLTSDSEADSTVYDYYCTGTSGCCVAPFIPRGVPSGVQAKWVYWDNNHTFEQIAAPPMGWFYKQRLVDGLGEVPLVLDFGVRQHLPQLQPNSSVGECPQDVQSMLCKSEHSQCSVSLDLGYTCNCAPGYDGNPYLAGGCQDLCNFTAVTIGSPCFGYCKLKPGQQPPIDCRCQGGTHGNPYKLNGCVKSLTPTGLIIGLSVASGPALLLLVLGIMLVRRKIKQHRKNVLKQKYFKQNRGQLLQQLLSQKEDIAEKMIIPLDELVKATNNFGKAREIGGGGHGTVYKGILSDQHVVAIKKSKIAKQKDIDEFINEVAILSQINHKNVVRLFGCCLETEVPLLVYEFVPNETLYHHLHIEGQERSLSWSNRLRIATEIANSLAYLHSSVSIPIIHRDIKSLNILLNDSMTPKVSDFGASRYIPMDNTRLTTRIHGTFGYCDPECIQTGRHTDKSDVYSFGVILVELLTRKKPTCPHLSNEYGGLVRHFLNLLASRNLEQIMDPQVLEEGGTEVQEVAMLAASCINLRGEERPTMRQVEHTLEGLQQHSSKMYKKDDMVTKEFESAGAIEANYASWTKEGHKFEESSRRYSLEQEMMLSARHPR